MKIFNLLIFLGIALSFLSIFIYADSNGIWHKAEDIKGGIFAFDEQVDTTNFIFNNTVNFLKQTHIIANVGVNTKNLTAELEVNGTIKAKRILANNFRNINCPKALAIVGLNETGDLICERMIMR